MTRIELVEVMADYLVAQTIGRAFTGAELAEAALSAIEQSGLVVVPAEQTREMLLARWPLHHPWGVNAPLPEDRPNMFAEMTDRSNAEWAAQIEAGRVK